MSNYNFEIKTAKETPTRKPADASQAFQGRSFAVEGLFDNANNISKRIGGRNCQNVIPIRNCGAV